MKRILSLVLVLVMLFSAAVMTLTSCGEEEKPADNKQNNNQGGGESEDSIYAEREAIDDELPERDYKGRTFRIASPRPTEIKVSETAINKGNLILDAKYDRNQAVENRFNVNVEVVYGSTATSEVNTYVAKTILSGVDEFDLFIGHQGSTGALVLKNLFTNWYDIDYIDFDKPWWAESCKDELTYDGKAILAVSDLNHQAIECTYAMFFNKSMAASYELGNLYNIALNGNWTYDTFYGMIKDIWEDDGDGKKNSNDTFGFVTDGGDQTTQWLYAFENPIMTKDADGIPQISLKTSKINDIVKKIYDLNNNTTGAYLPKDDAWTRSMFIEGKAMFIVARIDFADTPELRNFTDDYGILPIPKYDENQQSYHTMSYAEQTVLAVPKTAKDLEFVGIITEALSAESYKKLTPTFYEIALKSRYLRDDESKEVLDIIIENRVFDFGYIYSGTGSFGSVLHDVVSAGGNFESYYQQKSRIAGIHYDRVIRAFDKLS